MPSAWRRRLIKALLTCRSSRLLETGSACVSFWVSRYFHSGGTCATINQIASAYYVNYLSGNGLVSYYIDLVLKNVGITDTNTKTVINGCLQIFNFVIAFGAAMLVDVAGRRPLFIISNAGMLGGVFVPYV